MPNDYENNAQTKSIIEIISQIDQHSLVLPEFQRDFVWTIEKTLDLFDSLIRDIYIGSLIFGIPQFGIAVRNFDTSKRVNSRGKKKDNGEKPDLNITCYSEDDVKKLVSTSNLTLVLDGQQRITSIYRALKGYDEIWFTVKNDFDLIKTCRTKQRSLEELFDKFTKDEPDDRLCIKLSDAFKCMSDEDAQKLSCFRSSKFGTKLDDDDVKKAYESAYLYIVWLIVRLFGDRKIVSYFLLNMSTEKFALFFERSNSKGMQLSFIDILVSKLYGGGFKLRDEIELFNREHEYELSPEIAVRSIAYIVSGGHDIDKNYILSKLKSSDFKDHWKKLMTAYDNVISYLYKNHYIIKISDMPYMNMLIPLIVFAYNLYDQSLDSMTAEQSDVLDWWYWSVAFSKHYSGSSNEAIMLDSDCLLSLIKASGENTEKIKKFFKELKPDFQSAEDIAELGVTIKPIYLGMMGLICKLNGGNINWESNKLLATLEIDSHHIFPKQYLVSKGVPNSEIESIANRVLIYKITNIKIGKKSPSCYLSEILKNNPNLNNTLMKSSIPDGLIAGKFDDNYGLFLLERSKMIYDIINHNVFFNTERVSSYFKKYTSISDSGTTQTDERETVAKVNQRPPQSPKAKKFSFEMCGIKVGEFIQSVNDPEINCKVLEHDLIEYNGKALSLSKAAQLIQKTNSSLQGPRYFTYNGKLLTDIRKELHK